MLIAYLPGDRFATLDAAGLSQIWVVDEYGRVIEDTDLDPEDGDDTDDREGWSAFTINGDGVPPF